jgi:hypothetical protein
MIYHLNVTIISRDKQEKISSVCVEIVSKAFTNNRVNNGKYVGLPEVIRNANVA